MHIGRLGATGGGMLFGMETKTLTIDAAELATILHKSVNSVRADLCRAPWRLPPFIRPAREALWLLSTVEKWLEGQQIALPAPALAKPTAAPGRRRGRPTKEEQLRRAGALQACATPPHNGDAHRK